MKRAVWSFLTVAALVCGGCARSVEDRGTELFYCTQDRVCASATHWDAYEFSKWACDTDIIIPGLGQNFVPQGIACWEDKGWFLISGYFTPLSGNGAAALLAVDASTGKMVGEYSLTDGAGRELGGHFSGVAVTENDVYVTGNHSLYRISLSEFDWAGKKGALQVARELPLAVSADSCNYSNGILWVSEYYQSEAYPLKGEHVTLCADGTAQNAWMVGYEVADRDCLVPKCVFSIPDKIQGITALADGRLFLSQSYGRKNASRLFLFSDPRDTAPDSFVNVDGTTVPLWHLDSRNKLLSMRAPPMAEGCSAIGEGAYILFESAAYYYRSLEPDNRSVDPTDTVWYVDMSKKDEHRGD